VLAGYATLGMYAEGTVFTFSGHMSPKGTLTLTNGNYAMANTRFIDNVKGPSSLEVGGTIGICIRRVFTDNNCWEEPIAFYKI
jgi:hypothetical protein